MLKEAKLEITINRAIAEMNSLRAINAEMKAALKDIRDHSLSYDFQKIYDIADRAIAKADSK